MIYRVKSLPYILVAFFASLFFFVSFLHHAHAITYVNSDINADTTWTLAGSPYIIEKTIIVLDDATLTIEPGVAIKFKLKEPLSSIYVFGKIIAQGTNDMPIYFTSFYDDIVAPEVDDEEFCDEEYDEQGNVISKTNCIYLDFYDPQPRDWGGLFFISSVGSTLENTHFSYGKNFFTVQESDINIFKNIEISHGEQGMVLFNHSSVNFENVVLRNISSNGITLFNNSFLNFDKFIFEEVNRNPVIVFNESSFSGYGLDMGPGITSSNRDYVVAFNGSNLVLKDSIFRDCDLGSCINIFDGNSYEGEASLLDIDKTIFEGGSETAITIFGSLPLKAKITNSVFGDFPLYAINNFSTDFIVDARKNFWGDASGPRHATSNPTGLGEKISGLVDFEPWCKNPECTFRNPVIFIPGTTGSFLYKDYDDKKEIWPDLPRMLLPGADSYLNDLALEVDGTENSERPIKPNDIIRKLSGVDVFGSMIEDLEAEGYVEGVDLFVFAYDWRKSVADSAVKLKEKIDEILANSDSDKVDLLNHSMGGLIAKKYIADNGGGKVDQLFFFGTPHLGAPKGFKALMYGDSMGFDVLFNSINILSPSRVKFISQNMPGVYELMPSEKYFDRYTHYVVDARDKENTKKLNFTETKDLMLEFGRNSLMFPFAKDLHDTLDDLDLSGVETHNFIGCGTKTIGQITLTKKRSWKSGFLKKVDDYEIAYINGDQTVPLYSASETPLANKYFVKNITHGTLPSSLGLRQNVLAILNGNILPNSADILASSDECKVSGKVVSTHSPVELHIYDEAGNHTGMNTDGEIEYGIAGVEYDSIEDVNYAFLPDGINFKIVIKATDTGGYTFNIEDQNADDVVEQIHNWTLVPLDTLSAKGEIFVGPDYTEENYEIKMDQDGDGETDKVYSESFDGTSDAEEATTPKVETPSPAPSSSGGGGFPFPFPQKENIPQVATQDKLDLPVISNINNSNIEDNPNNSSLKIYTKKVSGAGKVAGVAIENPDEGDVAEFVSSKDTEPNKQSQNKNFTIIIILFGSLVCILLAKFIIKR